MPACVEGRAPARQRGRRDLRIQDFRSTSVRRSRQDRPRETYAAPALRELTLTHCSFRTTRKGTQLAEARQMRIVFSRCRFPQRPGRASSRTSTRVSYRSMLLRRCTRATARDTHATAAARPSTPRKWSTRPSMQMVAPTACIWPARDCGRVSEADAVTRSEADSTEPRTFSQRPRSRLAPELQRRHPGIAPRTSGGQAEGLGLAGAGGSVLRVGARAYGCFSG
jgi:hypothetical protein